MPISIFSCILENPNKYLCSGEGVQVVESVNNLKRRDCERWLQNQPDLIQQVGRYIQGVSIKSTFNDF